MKNEASILKELALNTGDQIVVPKSMFGLVQHLLYILGVDPQGRHFISKILLTKVVY